MKRLGLLVLAAAFAFLIASPLAAAGTASRSLVMTVNADGYVHVSQTFSVDARSTSVQVPLLSPTVSDLMATDQNGSPLSYGFAPGGVNITVYTLGASSLTLRYDTSSLTSKNGSIWTLSFKSSYNSTVILPQLSTLSSASGVPYPIPYSINVTKSSPEMTLATGTWKISYGVPFAGLTTASAGSSATGALLGPGQLWPSAGVVIAAAAVAAAFFLLRRRRAIPNKGDLRPDDVQVLGYIREKGGKVLEPEIRTRFALPKTSAWRQIKRLERMGYVRVTKVGSQNQIELLKDRNVEG